MDGEHVDDIDQNFELEDAAHLYDEDEKVQVLSLQDGDESEQHSDIFDENDQPRKDKMGYFANLIKRNKEKLV